MQAFESLVAMLARRDHYWVSPNFKLELTPEQKRRIGLPSCPRWEFDIIAYKAATNEVLVIECKSFLDSKGVRMSDGMLMREKTYKIFNNKRTRETLFEALEQHLVQNGMCRKSPEIRLVLAAGKVAMKSRPDIKARFNSEGWVLWDEDWIGQRLTECIKQGYEDDAACIAVKLLDRYQQERSKPASRQSRFFESVDEAGAHIL